MVLRGRLLLKDVSAEPCTHSPYRPRRPRPRVELVRTSSSTILFELGHANLLRENVVERCIRPTSAFQPPTDLYPCSRFSILRSKGGTFSRCPIPALAGRAATRAVLGRLDRFSSVHDFTKDISSPSPHALWRRGSRSFPACLVKRRALPRSEMSFLGGRWSAAPPCGGSPSGFPKEPSHNGRRSHGFAALVRRYVALRAREACLPRASPCLRVICGVPYGRPEKTTLLWTTTFRPNSATRTDARARPYGLQCSSPARDALSRLRSRCRVCHRWQSAPCGEPCRSALPPR